MGDVQSEPPSREVNIGADTMGVGFNTPEGDRVELTQFRSEPDEHHTTAHMLRTDSEGMVTSELVRIPRRIQVARDFVVERLQKLPKGYKILGLTALTAAAASGIVIRKLKNRK